MFFFLGKPLVSVHGDWSIIYGNWKHRKDGGRSIFDKFRSVDDYMVLSLVITIPFLFNRYEGTTKGFKDNGWWVGWSCNGPHMKSRWCSSFRIQSSPRRPPETCLKVVFVHVCAWTSTTLVRVGVRKKRFQNEFETRLKKGIPVELRRGQSWRLDLIPCLFLL